MRAKAEAFPLTVKAGSTAVKIYRDRKGSRNYYRVVYHLGGKRQRLNFTTLEEAKTEAQAKAAQLARGDLDAVQLTGKDRLAYGWALDAVKEFGISLDAAAIDYAAARKILCGHSLTEAARFFMRHHGRGVEGKPVAEAIEAFRAGAAGRSKLYLDDLRYRLQGFGEAFNGDTRQLVPTDVRDFLKELKLSPRSFNNHRRTLQTFFRFCQARGWLTKESDLLEGVSKRKEAQPDIEVFTAAELRKILRAAPPKLAACIALQAFAGVRSEELLRLSRVDVERRKGYIEITAGKAKTAQRRLIPIMANLAAWLADAPRNEERIWPHSKPFLFEALRNAAAKANVDWKINGLRHSFITYRLAAIKDVAEVALEAGNSPTMIFRHYRELATDAEATEWFGILPANEARNVVRMTA